MLGGGMDLLCDEPPGDCPLIKLLDLLDPGELLRVRIAEMGEDMEHKSRVMTLPQPFH